MISAELARVWSHVFWALVALYTAGYAFRQWRLDRDGLRAVRFLALCATAFCILFGYAIARPATETLFMDRYGVQNEPWVWVFSPIAGAFIVGAYNRYSTQTSLTRLFAWVCVIATGFLAIVLAARRVEIPGATFALYIWKDFYIVFLVEIFWTYANATYPVRSARWAYGIFCAWGAAGGLIGNLSVGGYARSLGTANALWLVVPTLILAVVVFSIASRGLVFRKEKSPTVAFVDGFRRVFANRSLVLILSLVLLSQFVVTLIDFRWKLQLQDAFPVTADRTAAIGRVYAAISLLELALQIAAGVILKFIGAAGVLLMIPSLLVLGGLILRVAPSYLVLASIKVASKGLDYSLFRIAKELLYIPLSYEAKTRGKAVIDILGYRAAKGGISLVLIVPAVQNPAVLDSLAVVSLLAWALATGALIRFHRIASTPRA